jgi:hypothetical protein
MRLKVENEGSEAKVADHGFQQIFQHSSHCRSDFGRAAASAAT